MPISEVDEQKKSSCLSFSIIIPTYNAGSLFKDLIDSIHKSTHKPDKVVVIDSSSVDGTADLAVDAGFELITISQSEFDHGGTRNLALSHTNTDVVLFMTQDAILQDESTLSSLLMAFENSQIAAAYGRQLPHHNAKPLGAFARLNNYPERGYLTSQKSDYPKGIRKVFMSNSFAAYRYTILKEVGGFPEKLILGEDACVAGRMLLAGYQIEYVSSACARHSHNYSLKEELKRYYDIGVFHNDQKWLLGSFGAPEKTGMDFAIKQTVFLIKNKKSYLIPYSILSLMAKYLGYRLGRGYLSLPKKWRAYLSMHEKYWVDKSAIKNKINN